MAKLFLSATATPLLVTSVVGQIGDVSEEQVASALNALTDENRLSYEALKDVPITFSPTQGAEGTAISIYGAGFTGAVGASINGTALDSFAVVSDTLITGVVGAGTATGKVEVGTAESLADFVIFIPSVDWGDLGGNAGDNPTLEYELLKQFWVKL